MRELILPPYPFALDSPQTHCVPSLVCSKTPCFCCETPCISPHSIAFTRRQISSLSIPLKPTAFLHSFALKLPAFPRPSIFLVLIRPQSLLVHSLLNPSRSLALKPQNLDVLPTDASCCKASACRGPRWAKTTTILSPWSDSRAWWVTRVGFISISVRPGVLMTPTRFANHAQPSDQRICVVVVLWCHGP